MKSKTKFIEMYNNLPKQARSELVYNFINHPMTLNVCYIEIYNDTIFGNRILKKLGYEDK